MNKDFSRIIVFLRKERGISQKQAAADLGVSQALLSHYEKGIRECGLDFLVRAADYYEVSTDYLLGRTVQRSPVTVSELPESDEFSRLKGNMINQINRRLPSFKQVKAVEIRETEFEKTTTKKIKRHLVK